MLADASPQLQARLQRLMAGAADSAAAQRFRAERAIDPTVEALSRWRAVCPAEFKTATWASLQMSDPPVPPEVMAALDRWLERPSNLMIYGAVGAGKSHLAAALCDEVARRTGKRADWVNLVRFFAEAAEFRHGAVRRYLAADVLVLDDIAAGRAELTGFQADQLYLLVNERWERKLPTIVTTNAEPKTTVKAFVGERCYDRIRDGAVGIRLTGDSRRGQGWQ